MFDYDVSTLKDFTFSSIYDVFALIAQNYPVRSRYDIELFRNHFLKNIKKNMKMKKKNFSRIIMVLKELLRSILHAIY